MVTEVPELGELDNKQCSALIGVAPLNRESGTYKGCRKIHGGRKSVRAVLYMAAFNALKVNPKIKEFADRLRAKGKPYKVIMVALMHKLIIYANAILKNNKSWISS